MKYYLTPFLKMKILKKSFEHKQFVTNFSLKKFENQNESISSSFWGLKFFKMKILLIFSQQVLFLCYEQWFFQASPMFKISFSLQCLKFPRLLFSELDFENQNQNFNRVSCSCVSREEWKNEKSGVELKIFSKLCSKTCVFYGIAFSKVYKTTKFNKYISLWNQTFLFL